MKRYAPRNASPNKTEHESVTDSRHRPCENCGRAGYAHNRVRVNADPGYYYELRCPE